MKKANRILVEAGILEQETDNEQYSIVLKGGTVGEKTIRGARELSGDPVIDKAELFDNIDDAKAKQKRFNKMLSPGEKKHYGLRYIIVRSVNGIYTGK